MEAMKKPCAECPWRKSNRGRPHPHGWYTLRNLRRLWAGLRNGAAPGMTCHPTDPDNLVPEGHRAPPEKSEPKECAGALLLIQRELKILEKDPKRYVGRNPDGLTRAGIHWWAIARCIFSKTPFGGPPIPVVEEDPDISRPAKASKERPSMKKSPGCDVVRGWCRCGEFHETPRKKEPPAAAPETPNQGISAMARDLGRLGGLKGGPARAKKLAPERRREIAKKAAETRWSYPFGIPRL